VDRRAGFIGFCPTRADTNRGGGCGFETPGGASDSGTSRGKKLWDPNPQLATLTSVKASILRMEGQSAKSGSRAW